MTAPTTFEAIMQPLGADAFLRDHLGKAPLHLEGTPDKWREVMDWPILNRLLGITTVWSQNSFVLMLDKEPVPVAAYAGPALGRDGAQVLRPDPARVKPFLAQGATLVLNDIDQLTPELSAFARALEGALGAKLQANLYLSSKKKQGFRAHFDFHDVFAVHVMGEKTWMVFEGRADAPISHPLFQNVTAEQHEAAKGELWKEVRLKPGALLYLPRGQYHYALADEGPCAHIAFGATYPIGIDVVSYLFERMVHEPVARRNLPRDEAELGRRLGEIGERVRAVLADPRTRADIAAFQQGFRYGRDGYDLPGLVEAAEPAWQVRAGGLRLIEQGGRVALAKESTRQAVEVPAPMKPLVQWVLARERFARSDLDRAFTGTPAALRDEFVAAARRMALIVPAPLPPG